MNLEINFSDIKSSSNLFIDFINNIQTENYNSIKNKIPKILERNYDKSKLIDAISMTYQNIELSAKQKQNIELLNKKNSLAVVTGQQAGFLLGPLYTLYKALDTYKISENLKLKYPAYNFIPIFWIEDNDNDLTEASHSYLFDESNNLVELNLAFDKIQSVSHTYIGNSSLEIINLTKSLIMDLHPNGAKYSELIDYSYCENDSWSYSFTKLMNKIIGEQGIIFLSANKLIKTGIFHKLVLNEINEFKKSKSLIEEKNEILISKNYKIQAKVSDINLFYHIDNNRFNIERIDDFYFINEKKYSQNEIIDLIITEPKNFSPKVLLRPLFQDYALPTVSYIAGPGEIAYHSQLDYLYQYLEIPKPAILMRSSYTIIDKKISRYLNKINKKADYFLNTYLDIEKDIANNLLGKDHNIVFENFRKKLDYEFAILETYLLGIDSQLERTIKGVNIKIMEQIEQLDKKAHSFAKRNNEELIQKYKQISNSIYPQNSLQERLISPIQFLSLTDNFIQKLLENSNVLSTKHIFLEL